MMILVQAAITAIRGVAATATVAVDVVEMRRITVLGHVTTAAKASADTTATMMSTAATAVMMASATVNDPTPATETVMRAAVIGATVSAVMSVPAARGSAVKVGAAGAIHVMVSAAKAAAGVMGTAAVKKVVMMSVPAVMVSAAKSAP